MDNRKRLQWLICIISFVTACFYEIIAIFLIFTVNKFPSLIYLILYVEVIAVIVYIFHVKSKHDFSEKRDEYVVRIFIIELIIVPICVINLSCFSISTLLLLVLGLAGWKLNVSLKENDQNRNLILILMILIIISIPLPLLIDRLSRTTRINYE